MVEQPLPPAAIRNHVRIPLTLHGISTTGDVFTFSGLVDDREHLLIGLGDWNAAINVSENPINVSENPWNSGRAPLVRPHSECMTGDVFGSLRCDCGPQLREAIERITDAGGFLLYLRQEGRGIGLYAKLDAYALQDAGLDTYAANRALGHSDDEREYRAAAQMLASVGASRIRLLSNNPDKAAQLTSHGITIVEQLPTGVHLSEANTDYLRAKRDHTGHTLDLSPSLLEATA